MPRYFIDTSNQTVFDRDDEGAEYESLEAAKVAAVLALPDMAKDDLPDGHARTFLAMVRDENGKYLLQAALSLHVAALVPNDER